MPVVQHVICLFLQMHSLPFSSLLCVQRNLASSMPWIPFLLASHQVWQMRNITKRLEGRRRVRLEMYIPSCICRVPMAWSHPLTKDAALVRQSSPYSSPWIQQIIQFLCHLFLLGSWLVYPHPHPLSLFLFLYIHVFVPSGCYNKNTID